MAESGCLRDGHFQNLEVSGKPFFSRANTVTQTATGQAVTSNGASGTIVLAAHNFDCLTRGAGVVAAGSAAPASNHFFRLHNNHINKESNIFFSLNLDTDNVLTNSSKPNLAYFVHVNETKSLQAGIRIAAVGNGARTSSIGSLNYLVVN